MIEQPVSEQLLMGKRRSNALTPKKDSLSLFQVSLSKIKHSHQSFGCTCSNNKFAIFTFFHLFLPFSQIAIRKRSACSRLCSTHRRSFDEDTPIFGNAFLKIASWTVRSVWSSSSYWIYWKKCNFRVPKKWSAKLRPKNRKTFYR